ncbi:FAD-dependent oxidoreductase [Oscillospiraceae bacterium OttesenSCG-928-G22]|nr:FAD-dependent oxidoreductase [Oscillospiraceae bacterium OttesenSCG-928-G22]
MLVVGSGAAAFSAAITAKNRGASVIMLEKAAEIGGTTARSGGGYWIPNNRYQREAGYEDDRAQCLRYMARCSYPHLYNPDDARLGLPAREYALLAAYYDNAADMVEHFSDIGALASMPEINWTGKPQVDYLDHLPENGGIRGRSLYPRDPDGRLAMGAELISQLHNWAASNGIDIRVNCEATKLLTDGAGAVTGLEARTSDGTVTMRARKGVIFGSGGFSHNPELMLRFQRGPHYGGCAVPTNTGDFVRMAGAAGAGLGNMAGAFRADSMLEAALESPGGSSNVFYVAGDSVLIVNKYGKRIVDEKRNYNDRAMAHFAWDAQRGEWENLLTFLIFDERTATLWQGFPPYPVSGTDMPYLIKEDTFEALRDSIAKRLHTLRAHTGGFSLEPSFLDGLNETVRAFNRYAADGVDPEFHRGDFAYDREWTTFPPTIPGATWPETGTKNHTMHPLRDEGPYYAIILAAGTLDTNGGPLIDENAQILDWEGRPIRGLYGAGNCVSSPTANSYWGAGSTIGPAMTFGYLAALHAIK